MLRRKFKEYTWLKSDAGKRFEIYLQYLQEGDYRYLGNVFCALAEKINAVTEEIAKVLCECIYKMSFNEIIKVDAMMRDTSSMEWFFEWKNIKLDTLLIGNISAAERQAVLVVASFHPNGFIREHAVQMLAEYENSLPYLVLRTNDWVLQVRQATKSAIDTRLNHLSKGELITALPYFEKMKVGKRSRNDYDVRNFYKKLSEPEQSGDLAQGLKSSNQFTRRLCLNALLGTEPLNSSRILDCLKCEKIPFIRYSIYKRLLRFDFPQRQMALDLMLQDKYPRIRKMAFEVLAKQNNEDFIETAKKMLLDKHFEVRNIARNIARNIVGKIECKFDFRGFYINSIKNGLFLYSAICGLGETGNKDDAFIVWEYLNHDLISVTKATMYACFQLNADEYLPIIISMLDDKRSGVLKQAYKLIKNSISDFDAIKNMLLDAKQPYCRKRCAEILMMAPKWQQTIFILELFEDNDEKIRKITRLKLEQWLRNFNRSFTNPNKSQTIKIFELLDKTFLPKQEKMQLDFIMKAYR